MSKLHTLAIPAFVLVFAATAFAQPGGGRGGFGGGRGGFQGFGGRGGGDSLVELALRDDVGKALEIVGPQKDDIEKIRESVRESMGDMREKLQGVPREDMFAKMRELIAEANEKGEKELADVLLPHQMSRLKQLQFQRRSQGGASRALGREDIREELGLTDAQMGDIQEAAEKAQEELREEMAKLRAEAEKKILAVLTPEQRKKWEAMAGDPFEFEETRGPGGFGGRGGPGGPGGPGGFGGRGGPGGRGGRPGGRPQAE